MFDAQMLKLLKAPFEKAAQALVSKNITVNSVTLAGFALGIMAFLCVVFGWFWTAIVFLLLNRIGDGLDGAMARQTCPTNSGAFLDIVLDFFFYSLFVLGFALNDPKNAVYVSVLIFAFVTTGSSFLAFSIMAERLEIKSQIYSNKGFYYLGGLTEGFETIMFFIGLCLWPQFFSSMALVFAFLCLATGIFRVYFGYKTIKKADQTL